MTARYNLWAAYNNSRGSNESFMSNVMAVLSEERTRVARRLAALDSAIKALGGGGAVINKPTVKRSRFSAEARARMAAAQKKRWAAAKK